MAQRRVWPKGANEHREESISEAMLIQQDVDRGFELLARGDVAQAMVVLHRISKSATTIKTRLADAAVAGRTS